MPQWTSQISTDENYLGWGCLIKFRDCRTTSLSNRPKVLFYCKIWRNPVYVVPFKNNYLLSQQQNNCCPADDLLVCSCSVITWLIYIMIMIVMMKKPAWIQTKTNRGIWVQDELNQVGRLHVLNQQLEPGDHPSIYPSYDGPQQTSTLRMVAMKTHSYLRPCQCLQFKSQELFVLDSEQFNRKQTWCIRMSGGHNQTSKQAKLNE